MDTLVIGAGLAGNVPLNDVTAPITAKQITPRETDEYGAPEGLAGHREFAETVGLPIAVSEWSANADEGDLKRRIQGVPRADRGASTNQNSSRIR